MTLATGTNQSSRGFTLLELCICLCILAALLAALVPTVAGSLKEERLRHPARYLSLLATTARLNAIRTQQTYQVGITATKIWIAPLVIAKAPDSGAPPSTSGTADVQAPSLPDAYSLSESTQILVKAWDDKALRPPGKFLWTFQPSGLCDPIAVKFIENQSELELDFDPLTATVAWEKFYFP